ncbi:MAG: aldo/keto reductase [Alphaproteobacteria bacterium]|jgi:diketogulonate reductase-like aldo/keto reductase|nr:aldo/keto reductase [Alphaproteobacteria bacterium]
MSRDGFSIGRRSLLQGAAGLAALAAMTARAQQAPLTRAIPSSGEKVPLVGLGTWITFNVGRDQKARETCSGVMQAFFAAGGRMIDSSPMYASSQDTIGYGLQKLGRTGNVFSAEKVWVSSLERGATQMEESRRKWGLAKFDLMQVHNLVSWEEHLPRLQAMKASGQLRYVGITTSEGRRHGEFERIMREHRIDFAQLTYNILDREAESRLLPLAQERGIAVIANRPFREGALLRTLAGKKLPAWAGEIGAASWAQFVLKFIVSHPAITCAIPATSKVDHVRENMAAASGKLPDAAMRKRMADYVEAL